LIAGEDVQSGKPAPDCYLLAAERLGQRIEDCLVFEDAPAGIEAAETAGASVMVISATHKQQWKLITRPLQATMASWPKSHLPGFLRIWRNKAASTNS
jgi:beta-phosphoglucomutase-like phosphatase (HAD superfamily)